MNKKLIAIAVASAMSVPAAVTVMVPTTVQADDSGPTIYGRLRAGLQRVDSDASDSDNIGFEDGSSRFGIRGEEDLGNGLAAIYRYEWGTQVVEDNGGATGLGKRHSWVGLKGSFGQVTIGRQTQPFYGLTGTSYALGNEYTGNYGFAELGNGYSDKSSDSIVYSLSNGPVEFGASLELNQDDAANEDLDGWNVGLRYNFGAGRVALGYFDKKSSSTETTEAGETSTSESDSDSLIAFVDFNVGSGNVYLGATQSSEDGADVDSYHLGYGGRTGDIGYFASYDMVEPDGGDDFDVVTLGGAYYLSGRTRIYFETDIKSSDADGGDRNRQVVGIRHDF